jgi:hypothetical protein
MEPTDLNEIYILTLKILNEIIPIIKLFEMFTNLGQNY